MAHFKPSLLMIALAAAGLSSSLIPSSALAQEQDAKAKQAEEAQQEAESSTAAASQTGDASRVVQPETTEETIVIRGFRGSLVRSIDSKRYADTISEQISSDDLGALPDDSIADALTRLPGISAVRTGGQAAEINIRGLSGGFVLATLNGREQTSTSGTRSVEFDQYPSELIAAGAVYKSQKASLIEGGVAGTVALKTASPLDNREDHTFNFNVRTMYNDRADEIFDAQEDGHRISFSYQGKFLDETLGVSLGMARLEQPSVATQFIGLNYPTVRLDLDGNPDSATIVSEGMELQHKGGVETRDGYVAAIEWVPNDDFKLTADAFLSKFDSEQFARGFRVKFGGPQANYYFPNLTNGFPVPQGLLDQYNNLTSINYMTGGTVVRTGNSFTRVELVNDDDTEIDEVDNYGIKAEWNLTPNFSLVADLSYSSAKSDFQNRLLWSLIAEDATVADPVFDTGVAISYQLNGLNAPDVGFNQEDAFTDPNRVMPSKYGIYPYIFTDTLKAARVDMEYAFDDSEWFSSLEFGFRYSERNYDRERSVYEYGSDGGFPSTQPPFQLQQGMYNTACFSGGFSNFPCYLAIDIDSVLANWLPAGGGTPVTTWGANPATGLIDNRYAWSMQQTGQVWEDVFSTYLQANIDTELGDVAVTGNIGVRVVRTEQYATTLQNVDGDVLLGAQNIVDETGLVNSDYAPGVDGMTFTEYLPQINLNFRIDDDSQIRFAAADVMARAPIHRLSSAIFGSVNTDTQEFNASSTDSPYLKPFLATQFDLSYEYYFPDSNGAFVAAVFYKDIESFVETVTYENFDFSTTNIAVPETFVDPVSQVPFDVSYGDFTTAINNQGGGYIQGVELAYTQVFTDLPEFWSGLGVNISYAYTESEVQRTNQLGQQELTMPLDGLSRDVLSATIFWSYEDWEARVNTRYRSRFVSEQIAVNEQTVYFDEETVVDFQTSYSIDENTKVLFQMNNITDQPTKSYFGEEALTGTLQYFGTQYFLGITHKL